MIQLKRLNLPVTVFTLLFISCYIQGQSGFTEGDIITVTHDTISGYIFSQTNKDMLEGVVFKTGPEAETREYKPVDLAGFNYKGGRRFKSLFITVLNKDEKRYDTLEVFLNTIVGGDLSLYEEQKNFFKSRYYLRKNNGRLYELTNSSQSLIIQGYRYEISGNEHIMLLNLLADTCTRKLNKQLRIQRKPLTKAIIKLNECLNSGQQIFTVPPSIRKSIKLSYAALLMKSKENQKIGHRISILFDKHDNSRNILYSRQVGFVFRMFTYDHNNTAYGIYMFTGIPFQISSYLLSGQVIKLYYEAGLGLYSGLATERYNNPIEGQKNKTYFLLPMISPMLTTGIRVKLGKHTAFHFELTPSLFYSLMVDKESGISIFYYEINNQLLSGFVGAGISF